jgi:pilus assembly protein Flp/PilA
MKTMIRLFKEEQGATAIEYGLIAALISIAAIAAMGAVGTKLSETFSSVSSAMSR